MEKDKFVGPLLSKAKLEKLQEEYSVILREIIEYIIKELGQSIERQTVPEKLYKFWRKYSTKISIPKSAAFKMGYGNEIETSLGSGDPMLIARLANRGITCM